MLRFTAVALLAFAPATAALAQYQGPGGPAGNPAAAYAPATVAEIKADPKDDHRVTLEGKLINKVDEETYTFSDGTGEILVEIDEEDFPKTAVTETTVVVIEGEVDTHLVKDVDIDAERVTIKN